MSTSGRTGVLSGAVGLSRAAAYAPDWRTAFAGALAREVEERRFFLWLPVMAMGGVALNLAADREPVLWLPAALTALLRRARLRLPRPPRRARPVAGVCGPVRRISVDVAAHRSRRRAGARPHPHRVPARHRRGGGSEAGRGAHGDRGDRRRRHAAREDPAPGAGHDAQGPERRRRRLCGAEGAAPAALARGAARRLRFRPRRLLRRRRRRRLDARPDQDSAAARRREPGVSASRLRSTTRATASPSGSTGSSAATRARSPPPW